MMVCAGPISRFVERHPTVKMLALSFLLLIGVTLIAEGLDRHIPKGYIYFAMAFSVFVEMLNLRLRRPRTRSSQAARTLRPGNRGGVVGEARSRCHGDRRRLLGMRRRV